MTCAPALVAIQIFLDSHLPGNDGRLWRLPCLPDDQDVLENLGGEGRQDTSFDRVLRADHEVEPEHQRVHAQHHEVPGQPEMMGVPEFLIESRRDEVDDQAKTEIAAESVEEVERAIGCADVLTEETGDGVAQARYRADAEREIQVPGDIWP